MSCDVCEGLRYYPIHNRFGKELYTIPCPECLGSGLTEAEAESHQQHSLDLQRYNAAMAETRSLAARAIGSHVAPQVEGKASGRNPESSTEMEARKNR